MNFFDKLPERVHTLQGKLRCDRIGGIPENAVNREIAGDEDPSNMGKLRVITPYYPVGNGTGPEIEKLAGQGPLSPGLQALYDPVAWQQSGTLERKPMLSTIPDMPAWSGRGAKVPLLNADIFNIGKGIRSAIQTAKLPDWLNSSAAWRTGAGATVGTALGAGAGWLHNALAPTEESQVSADRTAAIGAMLGGILGYNRK